MTRPTCETCALLVAEEHPVRSRAQPGLPPPVVTVTLCKRFPEPQIKALTDWCGEHPDFPAYLEGLKKGQEDE